MRQGYIHVTSSPKAFSAGRKNGCKALAVEQQKKQRRPFFCWDIFELVHVGSLVFFGFWMCVWYISLLKASFIEVTALWRSDMVCLSISIKHLRSWFFSQGNHCQSSQLSWLDRANSAKSYSSTSGTSEMWWEFPWQGWWSLQSQMSVFQKNCIQDSFEENVNLGQDMSRPLKRLHLISNIWSLLEYDKRQHWITTWVVTSHGFGSTWSTCFNTSEA